MNSFLYHQPACSDRLKGQDDYVRAVFLTEMLADHLPRLPWFLRNLQCALEDSSTVLEKVCAALEVHPGVCAEFMRIAGMAEPAQPITSTVDQSVVLLGKQRVWTSAVAAHLVHEFNSTWSSAAQKKACSIGLERANRSLTRAHAIKDPAPEQAYVFGILSVVGLLPLLSFSGVTDQTPEWFDISPWAAEKQREIFGTDFLELGRWAYLLWKLPLENPRTEVISDSAPELFYSQFLPKDEYSPVAALTASPDSRNLVLI